MKQVKLAGVALAVLACVSPVRADAPRLALPIDCQVGKSCWIQQYPDHDPSPGALDYTCGSQTYDGHDGTDIRIRDTESRADVIAAAPGTVKAVRDGVADKLLKSQADREATGNRECGNGVLISHEGNWETQYCHLRQGSVRVRAGDKVLAGTKLGAVGYSGMAAFPHVHLTLRHDGKAIDPFTGGDGTGPCGTSRQPLWSDPARERLAYSSGNIIRTGFAPGAVDTDALKEGRMSADNASANWPAMVVYVWAINLKAGDEVRIGLEGPGGIASENSATVDRPKAQYVLFTGKKRPVGGWPKGTYSGRVTISNAGVASRSEVWHAQIN